MSSSYESGIAAKLKGIPVCPICGRAYCATSESQDGLRITYWHKDLDPLAINVVKKDRDYCTLEKDKVEGQIGYGM